MKVMYINSRGFLLADDWRDFVYFFADRSMVEKYSWFPKYISTRLECFFFFIFFNGIHYNDEGYF